MDPVNQFKPTADPVCSSLQGHILNFRTFAAMDSTSFAVSSRPTAAKTRSPFPMDETSCESTVTEAEATRCRMALGH